MTARTLARFVIVALALATFVGDARAQALEDVWFKLSINVSGGAITPGDQVEKVKGKVVAYMRLANPDEGGDEGISSNLYTFEVYSETAPDNWQISSVGFLRTAGEREEAMFGDEIGPNATGIPISVIVPDEDSTMLNMLFLARLKLKLDKEGAFKSASFKSSGGVLPNGNGGGDLLVGGAKVKGKSVPVEKLPFEP